MTKTKLSTPRVRQHRQQLRDAGNVRLEVSLGADVVADIKALAAQRGVPVWELVEDALIAHVSNIEA